MRRGTLVIIGGAEERSGGRRILREIAERVGKGKLCIATVASRSGDEQWELYRGAFRSLGVRRFSHLDVVHRHEAVDEKALRAVADADAVFFCGGDQLKITAELGGTLVSERIREIYGRGGLVAGTSAGASVMSETMMVAGPGVSSFRIGSAALTAPGLGLVKNLIIDQHFAERGRIGRLLGAVAQNPKYLGIGIDENTAVVMERADRLYVIGSGAVYVVDAHEATDSNVSSATMNETLSLFNIRLHHLSAGDTYDIASKIPKLGSPDGGEMRRAPSGLKKIS